MYPQKVRFQKRYILVAFVPTNWNGLSVHLNCDTIPGISRMLCLRETLDPAGIFVLKVCDTAFPTMGQVVSWASCPWGELSMGRAFHGASCPWGELSMRPCISRSLQQLICRKYLLPSAKLVHLWAFQALCYQFRSA